MKDFWITEKFSPNEEHRHKIKRFVAKKKTKYQNMIIADSYSYGRCLILDNEMQSAQSDEFIYHEALVHPAFLSHLKPQKIMIFGGGEGATLREVLKYKSIKNVVMIDIDPEVIEFCKKYLKSWHQNSFFDKRVNLIFEDARKYITDNKDKYDLIISDLPTPIKGSPCTSLYTKEFYEIVKTRLKKKGIFVTQAGSGIINNGCFHSALYKTLSTVFKFVYSYQEFIPSFDVPWAFLIASDEIDVKKVSPTTIKKRIKTNLNCNLKYYDEYVGQRIFNNPVYIRKILSEETNIITDKHLLYFYK